MNLPSDSITSPTLSNPPHARIAFRVFGLIAMLGVTPLMLWMTKLQTHNYSALLDDMIGTSTKLPYEFRVLMRINLSGSLYWSLLGLMVISVLLLIRLRRPVLTSSLCAITLLATSLNFGLSGYFCYTYLDTSLRVLARQVEHAKKVNAPASDSQAPTPTR